MTPREITVEELVDVIERAINVLNEGKPVYFRDVALAILSKFTVTEKST